MFFQLRTPTIEIEADSTSHDIEIYVRSEVQNLFSKNVIKIENLSLQGEIVQELFGKADGM